MHILVVSFIFPFPVTSGGARDIYARLKAMHEAGYEIDLVATVREDPTDADLDGIRGMLRSISIVHRHRSVFDLLSLKPFHNRTRDNIETIPLEREYLATIIESEFVAGILDNPSLRTRHRILRVHNDEANLHRSLAESASKLKDRFLFALEARKFAYYSPRVIERCDMLWYLSAEEMERS